MSVAAPDGAPTPRRIGEDATVIDRASAERALAALGDGSIDGEQLLDALRTVLIRKLGREAPPLPTGEDAPEKFQRFFDAIFDVMFEDRAMPTARLIEISREVVAGLEEDAAEAKAEGESAMVELYEADAADYRSMIALLERDQVAEALRHWRGFDTASRGRLFGRTQEEEHQLSILLGEHGI